MGDFMPSSAEMAEPLNRSQPIVSTKAHFILESRPSTLIVAHYADLPFPNIGPVQEVAFDLGITAVDGRAEVSGVVIKGYSGHQLLFEQRWPADIIRQRTGESDLSIDPGTGLAIRSMQFLLQGYELLTFVEVTVVGKVFTGYNASGVPEVERMEAILQIPARYHQSKTDLHFPLRGTWWAIQAADWSDQHKQEVVSQPFAIDFVKLGPDNRFFKGQGWELDEHYSWGQPVYATAGGKIAYICYDMPDLRPGMPPDPRMFRDDPRRLLGNAVAISHGNGEFSYYGHLQQASLKVAQGEMVKRGALLGYVGNSGQSPGPHLHFHLMEGPNPFIDQGLPVRFSHFEAGGQFFETPMVIPTRMIVSSPD